jgi:hypothetical protein
LVVCFNIPGCVPGVLSMTSGEMSKQIHKKGNNAGKDMTRKNKCSIWKDFKQENEPKRYDGDFSSPEMIYHCWLFVSIFQVVCLVFYL